MRLLLDTHVLLWWLADDPALSKQARQLIANEPERVWLLSAGQSLTPYARSSSSIQLSSMVRP